MKAEIDKDGCISCGVCASVCSEVFRMGDDGPAEVYVENIPSDMEKAALEAQDSCPVSVITVE
jgi:ferredoxin